MQNLVTKKKFMMIFSKDVYRRKLDTLLLNFFGLEASTLTEKETMEDANTIEFILLLNTEKLLSIMVKDTKHLFHSSKKIYINLSYREVQKHFEVLIPCYYEIYIPYLFHHQKENPKFYLLVSLFYCKTLRKAQNLLKKMENFNQEEIEDILKIIKK